MAAGPPELQKHILWEDTVVMTDGDIKTLRRNMRRAEIKIRESCAHQVPVEIFRYTLSQMRTIDTLYSMTRETGTGVQLKMLAESLSITPAAASEMVDTLVRKGAIIRRNDPDDRRAVRLYVGDVLRERFEKCEEQLDEITGRFIRSLSAVEQEVFFSVTKKFAEFTADPDNFPEVDK